MALLSADSFFVPEEPPSGYSYSPEAMLSLKLLNNLKAFSFNGVPLALPALTLIYNGVRGGTLHRVPRYGFGHSVFNNLLRKIYPLYYEWMASFSAVRGRILERGLLVAVESAAFSYQWRLVSGALPHLEDLPVWLLIGGRTVPSHVAETKLPFMNDYIKSPGLLSEMKAIQALEVKLQKSICSALVEQGLCQSHAQTILSQMTKVLVQGARAARLLDLTRPRLIVVTCDHACMSGWLVLLAKLRGIETVTLQHGAAIEPLGLLPLWADHALLWGECYARMFRAFGAPANRLHLVGCPLLPSPKNRDRNTLPKKKISKNIPFPTSSTIVFLATNNGDEAVRRRLAQSVWEGIQPLSNHCLLIKCHPAETKDLYEKMFAGVQRVVSLESDEISLESTLDNADVVVVYWSSVASDALVYGKPVVLYNLDGHFLWNQRLVDLGVAIEVKSSADLCKVLRDRSWDLRGNPESYKRIQRYLKEFSVAYGGEADKLTADTIRQIWITS